MINLNVIENQKFNMVKLVEILFYIFPISFIIGNLIVSLHLLIFIVFSLLVIKRKKLAFRFNNSVWVLIAFFLYLFLLTVLQFPKLAEIMPIDRLEGLTLENHPIFKSFLLMRFVLLILVIDTLFYNKILSLKKIFLFSLICTSFVSLDVIVQYFVGFDLFGIEKAGRYNSGPFGDELIAGSYLQKFSFFSIFYIFIFYKHKYFKNPLSFFVILIHIIAIILAGNRMPMFLFILGFFLIFLFFKEKRTLIVFSLITSLAISFVIIKNNPQVSIAYANFFENQIYLVQKGLEKTTVFFKNENKLKIIKKEKVNDSKSGEIELKKEGTYLRTTGHMRIFRTSIELWKERPFTGSGLKSFRIKCWEMMPRIKNLSCANHSHNYYLEFLSETGIIGLSIIIIFFIVLLKYSFNHLLKFKNINDKEKYLFIPIVIIFLLEIWPLRSAGSFFTTWNATLFWLNTSLLIAISSKKIA
jgi:O-antigen ligase